jgi:hypothetical protein
MQYLHKLIDREDPHCLYCQAQCTVEGKGEQLAKLGLAFLDQFICTQCKELFEIYINLDSTEPHAFAFTCNKMLAYCDYGKNRMQLCYYDKEDVTTNAYIDVPVLVPMFNIDFANKKLLAKKLRTYLTFS